MMTQIYNMNVITKEKQNYVCVIMFENNEKFILSLTDLNFITFNNILKSLSIS